MILRFTKMQGLGNDFVVIDNMDQSIRLSPAQIRQLADRHFGIGCDQLLIVEPSTQPDTDFRYRIYNADGGEVEQCGNGARCFARFVREKGLTDKTHIRVETLSGLLELVVGADEQVTVEMGVPRFAPDQIPFHAQQEQPAYTLEVMGQQLEIGAVSLGNPHAVLRVPDVQSAPVNTLGPAIERHAAFPARVNAGFMQILDRNTIALRVYERGAGETLACGSGACAAAVIGQRRGWLDNPVQVRLPGGTLLINWPGGNHPVSMTGPAQTVFEGQIEL
jgi:diaminopimelate epimerase